MEALQKKLDLQQISAFYIENFAADQSRRFFDLADGRIDPGKIVVDVGGGCGYFALSVMRSRSLRLRVIDTDQASIETCHRLGVTDAHIGDALNPRFSGDEGVACFNLILHHLIAGNERNTRALQKGALTPWKGRADFVFVDEYIYDPFFGEDLSGRLIHAITSSKLLSAVAGLIGRFIPALKANTFGVGVRFRSDAAWRRIFSECGYDVVGYVRGSEEITPPRRILMIKSLRRDSYLLRAKSTLE